MTKKLRSWFAIIVLSVTGIHVGAFADDKNAGSGEQNSWEQCREQWHQKKEKALQDLHTALALSGPQESAWSTWAATLESPDKTEQDREKHRGEWQGLTAIQKLERKADHMKEREKKLQGRIEATKAFYAVLTPVQKKTFDASFPFEKRFREGQEKKG